MADSSACEGSPAGTPYLCNGLSRPALQSHMTVLADKVSAVVSGFQKQSETDRRRIAYVERKVEARLDESLRESLRESDGREKWAEIQGSVKGLLEELQALTRRVEGLDERLWARTSGTEAEKQRHRELEQQVQTLDQHCRLHMVTAEETQKRQVAKLLRIDHSVEELARRFGKLEEEVHIMQINPTQQHHLEARISHVQQQHGHFDTRMRSMQLQLTECMQAVHEPAENEDSSFVEPGSRIDEAVHAAERGMAALERRVLDQVKDISSALAALRVKSDGTTQRVASLAERLETAHEPALEAMRAELANARAQDRREVDGEVVALRSWMQEVNDSADETISEVRQAIRQAHSEIAALTLRPPDGEAYRAIEERTDAQEHEVNELKAQLDTLPARMDTLPVEPGDDAIPGRPVDEDLDDIRRRLEWLEERGAASTVAEKIDTQKAAHNQETLCDLVEQVTTIGQRTSRGEATCGALQLQIKQVQAALETQQAERATPSQVITEVQVSCSEISRHVAKVEARLLEVEGGLQFLQESGPPTGGNTLETSFSGSDVHTVRDMGLHHPRTPPPFGADVNGRHGADSKPRIMQELQRKLEVVAQSLEVNEELVERVTAIERHLRGEKGVPIGGLANGDRDDDDPREEQSPNSPTGSTSYGHGAAPFRPGTPDSSTSAETNL